MQFPEIPEDKIRGMLIGMCIGDALGSKYEEDFDMIEYDSYLEGHTKVTVKERGHSHVSMLPAGVLSDASLVPLELGRALVVNPIYPWQRNNIITRYQNWMALESRPWSSPDMDRYFKGIKTINGYDKRWKEDSQQPINKMLINESVLTRMIPISCITTTNQYAYEEAKLTHHEPLVVDASVLYCNSLRLAFWDVDISEINNKIKENVQHPVIGSCIRLGQEGTECTLTGIGRTACFNPFFLLGMMEYQNIKTFEQAIMLIITRYQSGDIRYLCALIGAFYGAYLGYNELSLETTTGFNIEVVRKNKELQDFDTLCSALKQLSN